MLFIKFLAGLGALMGIYGAAVLQNGPEVTDANLCKLLRRVSSAFPDQCIPSVDDWGTAIAVVFVLLCVVLLLWDFRKHVFVSRGFMAAIKRLAAKLDPFLIPIGLGVLIIGAVIVGYGSYKQNAVSKGLRTELNAIKKQVAQVQPSNTTTTRQSMLSGRPVSGIEVAQRLESVETELDKAKQELAATQKELITSRQHSTPSSRLATVVADEPFYSRADVERILEALFETTTLLQEKAIPARDAAERFIQVWNQILLDKGEPAFRAELKRIRLMVEEVSNGTWAISNKYSHYNKELAPVFGGVAFAGTFFGGSNKFVEAGQNLPQNIDQKTLTFMTPMRDDYQAGIEAFKKWMSNTYDNTRTVTEKFRQIAQKAG